MQQFKGTARFCLQGLVIIETGHSLFPAYGKIELVPGKCTCECKQNNKRKCEVTKVDQESSQYQNG